MLSEFEAHINQHFKELKQAKILLAISGGIDSVVLAHLFKKLNFTITLAHCNFNLRGNESELDEAFVIELANSLNLPFHTIRFNTLEYANKHKVSTQMAARTLRYNWFESILESDQLDYVATAHHKNDQLETFLINLTRGSGIDGFTGIPEVNGHIIRPLLPFTRNQIEAYAKQNAIEWREDKSNSSTKYSRNKIRHQVIPVLEELNPSILDSFENTLHHLKASQSLLRDYSALIKKEVCSCDEHILKIDIAKLNSFPNHNTCLYELLKEYHFNAWDDIEGLLTAQSGKFVNSNTHRIVKDRDFLLVSKLSANNDSTILIKEQDTNLRAFGIHLEFKQVAIPDSFDKTKNSILIDKDRLEYPLILRKWKKGDYFYPLGMKGKKKLSNFFIDEKFSLLQKEEIWLLCNGNDDIIWIIGHRMDDRFKLSETTKKVLSIRFSKH